MPAADEFDCHDAVVLRIAVYVRGDFFLTVARKPERDGIICSEGIDVIVEFIGKVHADIADGKVRIAHTHPVRVCQSVVFFRHQRKGRPFEKRRIDFKGGPVGGIDLPFPAYGNSDLYGHAGIRHKGS